MSSGILVPVNTSNDAAMMIDELGLRRIVEEMIEHTRQVVPDLRSIEIEAWYEHEENDDSPLPHITVIGWRDGRRSAADETIEREWFDWSIRSYPPDVKQHISFAVQYRGDHGR